MVYFESILNYSQIIKDKLYVYIIHYNPIIKKKKDLKYADTQKINQPNGTK